MLAAVVLAVILVALLSPLKANAAATLPAKFQERVVFSGLSDPTNVEFSKDGRVFVAEKSGLIKVFDNLSDTTPTTFADLRTNVHNFWDRGLLGLALDPGFPARPYVYVLYTHDAPIGGRVPRGGRRGLPRSVPLAAGPRRRRLRRLRAPLSPPGGWERDDGAEQMLIGDWCQQYPSHSVGALAFGADGALYVERRRRRELHLRGLRAGRKPAQPVR